MAGLDPENWSALRALGHQMLDDMFTQIEHRHQQPVWTPMPHKAREELRQSLPHDGCSLPEIYERFQELIVPYDNGNRHPRFMGWVHGAGTPIGMLAEMLAGGLNANCGGRDHAAIEVEREVLRWAREMVGLPVETGSGCLVTGSSMANFIAVITASRTYQPALRQQGVRHHALVGYAPESAHGCLPRAFDIAGLGSDALREIPTDGAHRVNVAALREQIKRDRAAGLEPFMIAGTAGTVDCGAVDPLDHLADVAQEEQLWFHVDGAFGALACLSPHYAPLLKGIERADSVAFDFHKWAQVPYDAGCVLVRDGKRHAAAFAQSLDYLVREDRGLAGNAPWFCDFGPDLSRGFRALKVWMTLSHYGADRMGQVVDKSCAVARHLAQQIDRTDGVTLLAPVTLNIVCFTVDTLSDDALSELVKDLHETGIAAPSTTRINGQLAIRAAIVNHRTETQDVDQMLDAVIALATTRLNAGVHEHKS